MRFWFLNLNSSDFSSELLLGIKKDK